MSLSENIRGSSGSFSRSNPFIRRYEDAVPPYPGRFRTENTYYYSTNHVYTSTRNRGSFAYGKQRNPYLTATYNPNGRPAYPGSSYGQGRSYPAANQGSPYGGQGGGGGYSSGAGQGGYGQPYRPPKKKKKHVWWIVLLVIGLLAGVGGGLWFFLRPAASAPAEVISVMQACTPSFSGNNHEGQGTIACEWNYTHTDFNRQAEVQRFLNSVQMQFDGQENGTFSNGDTVRVKAVFDPQAAAELNVELADVEGEFTVDGLEPLFARWEDFSAEQQSALNDLAVRAIRLEYESESQKVESTDLIGLYLVLSPEDDSGKILTRADYLCRIDTIYTRYNGEQVPETQYAVISVDKMHPDLPFYTTLDGASFRVREMDLNEQTDTAARERYEIEYQPSVEVSLE